MPRSFPAFADRVLPSLTLLLWGGVFTYFYLSGRIGAYLHPALRPLVPVAGVLLLVSAGVVGLLGPLDEGGCDCGTPTPAAQRRWWRRLPVFAVLILPIAAAALLSPDTFSNAFIESRGLASAPEGTPALGALLALPTVAPRQTPAAFVANPATTRPRSVSMLDLMLAAQDTWCQKDFVDRRLELIGRYYPDNPRFFGLVSTLITCCALDARTLAIRVETPSAPDLEKLAWVKVVGTVRFDPSDNGGTVPVLSAESVTPIQSPADPYVYQPAAPLRQNRPPHH